VRRTGSKGRAGAEEGFSPVAIVLDTPGGRILHTGENLTQDFTIYGFGGTPNNFNEVRFPGDTRNCAKCHVSTASYVPPLQTGIASVTTILTRHEQVHTARLGEHVTALTPQAQTMIANMRRLPVSA